MQLVDRIEKRRFVGREFLLWLWFESELFDATLQTAAHGSFGLWLEKRLLLSLNKESTRITGVAPGYTRQAKAALVAGQLPESAAIRIAWHDDELGFVLKAERLAVGGLKLPKPASDDAGTNALAELAPRRGKPKAKSKRVDRDDEAHEAFYERMQRTEDFEGILEALFADFKALRLSAAWQSTVLPLLRAWARDEPFSHEAYAALRGREAQSDGSRPDGHRRPDQAAEKSEPSPVRTKPAAGDGSDSAAVQA